LTIKSLVDNIKFHYNLNIQREGYATRGKTGLLLAVLLVALTFVAACGGSGGGGTAPTAPLTEHTVQLIITAAAPPVVAGVPLPQTTTFTYSTDTAWSATITLAVYQVAVPALTEC
jgi:hypothetical protein